MWLCKGSNASFNSPSADITEGRTVGRTDGHSAKPTDRGSFIFTIVTIPLADGTLRVSWHLPIDSSFYFFSFQAVQALSNREPYSIPKRILRRVQPGSPSRHSIPNASGDLRLSFPPRLRRTSQDGLVRRRTPLHAKMSVSSAVVLRFARQVRMEVDAA